MSYDNYYPTYTTYPSHPGSYPSQPPSYPSQPPSYPQYDYSQYYAQTASYNNYPSSTDTPYNYASPTATTYSAGPTLHVSEKPGKRKMDVAPRAPRDAFPVSCGVQHKTQSEGYTPKRPAIPPDVMSRLALAKSKLESNPFDTKSQLELNSAMLDYQSYEQDKASALMNDEDRARRKTGYSGPGLFTGQPLVEPMPRDELDSDDIRTFACPDMFKNLQPLKENFGKFLMKRYGWREGKPLGVNGQGSLAPIELTVKIDRRGLLSDMEFIKRKPEGTNKNEGPNWICKIVNGKNPVSGISELHQAMGIPTPVFKMASEHGGLYKWNIVTNWGSFTPFKSMKGKKQAKSDCSHHALREILRIESEHKGVEPPTEAAESCFLRVVFIPSNKTAAGHKMLYKHFYSGGKLQNVLEPPGFDLSTITYATTSPTITAPPAPPKLNYNLELPPATTGFLAGAGWMARIVNGKTAPDALADLCQRAKKPPPEEYSQYIAGSNLVTVSTPWGTFVHSEGHRSRKEIRKMACYKAILAIMKQEAAKFNQQAPVELAESSETCLSFQ